MLDELSQHDKSHSNVIQKIKKGIEMEINKNNVKEKISAP
jgi:hypothetical protein